MLIKIKNDVENKFKSELFFQFFYEYSKHFLKLFH